jgi:hypothetical protein
MNVQENKFYVYVVRRAGGIPCYVGKGSRNRLNDHFSKTQCHNRHLSRIINLEKDQITVEKIAQTLTESEAFELEQFLIQEIGRYDIGRGPLANKTDGGEGESGRIRSEESREKNRIAALRQWQDPETRARTLAAITDPEILARRGATASETNKRPEVKEKRSSWQRGRKMSAKSREAMSIAAKARSNTPEALDRASSRMSAMWENPEFAQAISAACKGKKSPAETRAKQSAAHKARWAKLKGIVKE